MENMHINMVKINNKDQLPNAIEMFQYIKEINDP